MEMPQTAEVGPSTTEICLPNVLEARTSSSRCWQVGLFWGFSFWLVDDHLLPLVSWHRFPSLPVHVQISLSYKNTRITCKLLMETIPPHFQKFPFNKYFLKTFLFFRYCMRSLANIHPKWFHFNLITFVKKEKKKNPTSGTSLVV